VDEDDTQEMERRLETLRRDAPAEEAGQHLAPAVLAAYHAGELGAEEEEAVQRHLGLCRHCAALVLDLEAFLAPADDDPRVANLETEREWRALRDRLEREREGAYEPPARAFRAAGRFSPSRWLWVAAAALLVFNLGLVYRLQMLARQVETGKEPQVNVGVVTLRAEGTTRSADPEVADINLPCTLILPLPGSAAGREVGLAILDAKGAVRWSGHSQVVSDLVNVELHLPARSLRPGLYTIEVRAAAPAGEPPIARFDLRVER
jgi:hypothetical protein